MKKNYEKPEISEIEIKVEGIICASLDVVPSDPLEEPEDE